MELLWNEINLSEYIAAMAGALAFLHVIWVIGIHRVVFFVALNMMSSEKFCVFLNFIYKRHFMLCFFIFFVFLFCGAIFYVFQSLHF